MKIFKNMFAKLIGIKEIFVFMWQNKLWWLMPLIFILILFGLFFIFTQSTAIAPFIYTLF